MSAAAAAIARRAWGDGRTRTLSFALFFGLVAYVQVVGYEHSYPTAVERLQFAASFGDNKAIRLFYGVPHDLVSVGGYAAWRVGGVLSLFAAIWGIFAAVRAQRAEEDDGRAELVLAGAVGRRLVFWAALGGVGAGAFLLWLASWAGLAAGGLAAGGTAYLALEVAAVAAFFVGVGSLASQLAPTRRLALGLGTAAFAVAFALRIAADTAGSLEWLRWATPLGWAEELRPFTGAQPVVLALFAAATAALLAVSEGIARRRDVGTGILAGTDSAAPRHRGLGSPTALALRSERGLLVGWFAGIGVYALLIGLLADTFTPENLSQSLREELQKLGGASIITPRGAVGFYFLFFAFAISLFACAQISAARHEEADSRLETLFALPLARIGWLGGRLALAAAGAVALAIFAALVAWAGAATQAAGIGIGEALEAGLNTLPSSLLFLGLAALAFALVPRAAAGVAYGLVSVAFCWYLFGALLGAPQWTLDLSPFQHVAPVPAQPWKTGAALAMLAIGAATAAAALALFRRRDVLGA
ncbi:MAG: hypothetical protein U0R71_17980 [Solirubrobacterales bacterium]